MLTLTRTPMLLTTAAFLALWTPTTLAAEITTPPVGQAAPSALDLVRQGDRLRQSGDLAGAVTAYENAADKRSTIALLRLGDLYRSGVGGGRDDDKAFAAYSRAAATGNEAARLRVAEMTVRGQGTTRDVAAGMAAVKALADAGNASAWFDIGEFNAGGEAGAVDGVAAIAAYEKAADAGSVAALFKLGIIYRDGTLADADPLRALEYLQRAADAGSAAARFTIAKGYVLGQFGEAGSTDDGIAMLEELQQSGVGDAALVLSDSYFSGRGVTRDPGKAVAVLDEAADGGSVSAARRLVALYRDGRGKAVKRDVERAREYLTSVSGRLDGATLGIEEMLLNAATANTPAAYDTVRTSLAAVDDAQRPALVGKIKNTNVNVYVYLVQARLAELGTYAGKPNGLLDRNTIRAIRGYCADNGMAAACAPGPLSQSATEAILPAL